MDKTVWTRCHIQYGSKFFVGYKFKFKLIELKLSNRKPQINYKHRENRGRSL